MAHSTDSDLGLDESTYFHRPSQLLVRPAKDRPFRLMVLDERPVQARFLVNDVYSLHLLRCKLDKLEIMPDFVS